MKSILILFLLCLTFTTQDEAYNAKNPNGQATCGEEDSQESVSDCVDSKLYIDNRNYDRCCFVRVQYEGSESKFCHYFTEEDYLDIVETKRKIEKELYDKYIKDENEGARIKVYQIDCAASYIKFLSIASILLALLF